MVEGLAVSAPADPKQARSKQTKEKITQAAILLFQERGYEKTTSNDIAAAAGVSVGSFYVYFTDKRQLMLTIFDRLADEMFKHAFDSLKPEHPIRFRASGGDSPGRDKYCGRQTEVVRAAPRHLRACA